MQSCENVTWNMKTRHIDSARSKKTLLLFLHRAEYILIPWDRVDLIITQKKGGEEKKMKAIR